MEIQTFLMGTYINNRKYINRILLLTVLIENNKCDLNIVLFNLPGLLNYPRNA